MYASPGRVTVRGTEGEDDGDVLGDRRLRVRRRRARGRDLRRRTHVRRLPPARALTRSPSGEPGARSSGRPPARRPDEPFAERARGEDPGGDEGPYAAAVHLAARPPRRP